MHLDVDVVGNQRSRHEVHGPGQIVREQASSGVSRKALEKQRRRNSRNATKAVLQRAWEHVTHEHLAEVTATPVRAFTKALSMAEDVEPEMRWLLDCDGQEFEAAVREFRIERAAREKARGLR